MILGCWLLIRLGLQPGEAQFGVFDRPEDQSVKHTFSDLQLDSLNQTFNYVDLLYNTKKMLVWSKFPRKQFSNRLCGVIL